jgi:hypothetical protein
MRAQDPWWCRQTAAIRSHDDSLTRRGNWPRRHLHHRDNKPAIVSGQFTGMAVMGVQTRPAIVQAVRTQSVWVDVPEGWAHFCFGEDGTGVVDGDRVAIKVGGGNGAPIGCSVERRAS